MSNQGPKGSAKSHQGSPKPNQSKPNPQKGSKPNHPPNANSQQGSAKPNHPPKANTTQGSAKPNQPHKAKPPQGSAKPNNAPKGNPQHKPNNQHPKSGQNTNPNANKAVYINNHPGPRHELVKHVVHHNVNVHAPTYNYGPPPNMYRQPPDIYAMASSAINELSRNVEHAITQNIQNAFASGPRPLMSVPTNYGMVPMNGPQIREIRPQMPTHFGPRPSNPAIPIMPNVRHNINNNKKMDNANDDGFVIIGTIAPSPKKPQNRENRRPPRLAAKFSNPATSMASSVEQNINNTEDDDSVIINSIAPPPRKNNLNESENMLKDVINNLECSVCTKYFQPPIRICETGHNVCSVCVDQLCIPICQICNGSITDKRNVVLEEICAAMSLLCPNASRGCNYPTSSDNIKIHLDECEFRQFYCPFYGKANSKCAWIGNYNKIVTHFNEAHKTNCALRFGSVITFHDFDVYKPDEDLQLIKFGQKLFVYHVKIDVPKEVAFWAVQMIGSEEEAQNWKYEFNFYNYKKNKKMIEITEECTAESVDINKIFESGNCVAIPLFILKNYVQDNKSFNFKFYIRNGARQHVEIKNVDENASLI